jgi:hypothetical protein
MKAVPPETKASSLTIVPAPLPSAIAAPLVGADSVIVKVSLASLTWSPTTLSVIVLVSSLAAKLRSPLNVGDEKSEASAPVAPPGRFT